MSSGGGSMGDGFTETKAPPRTSTSLSTNRGRGGFSRPASLTDRIWSCICAPYIICYCICLIICAIPIIWVVSILSNFADHTIEWNTPMSVAMSKSSTLNGFGSQYKVRMNFNPQKDLPIRASFLSTVPRIAHTKRHVMYGTKSVDKGFDYQYTGWWLNPGSSMTFSGKYTSTAEDESLRMLALSSSQLSQFQKNATDVIINGHFLKDWILPADVEFMYSFEPNIGDWRNAGRFYLLHYFRDQRADKKRQFIEGSFTYSVDMTYYDISDQSVVDSCDLTEAEPECQKSVYDDWQYVVLQQDFDSDKINASFTSSELVYHYTPNNTKIFFSLFGILFAIVVCCAICLAGVVGITVGIIFLVRKLFGSKQQETYQPIMGPGGYQPQQPYQPYQQYPNSGPYHAQQPPQPYQPYGGYQQY